MATLHVNEDVSKVKRQESDVGHERMIVQFASYSRSIFAKTRLIFSLIKGPTAFKLAQPNGDQIKNQTICIYMFPTKEIYFDLLRMIFFFFVNELQQN